MARPESQKGGLAAALPRRQNGQLRLAHAHLDAPGLVGFA